MEVIKRNLEAFTTEVKSKLTQELEYFGGASNVYSYSDTPALRGMTMDNISICGSGNIMVECSDEGENAFYDVDALYLEELIFIIDWINQYKEEITESTNARANELLGDAYDEIFGDERGQVFKVEDMNFKFGGIRVVKVGDYYETNDHFPLYNDTDTDVWDTLLCGERLKIAEQIKLKLWEEKIK